MNESNNQLKRLEHLHEFESIRIGEPVEFMGFTGKYLNRKDGTISLIGKLPGTKEVCEMVYFNFKDKLNRYERHWNEKEISKLYELLEKFGGKVNEF